MHKQVRVGIVGTFDVANYGDLLFPIILRAAFAVRGYEAEVEIFSPNSVSSEQWPFEVTSVLDLPQRLPSLSALFVGGGQLLRFDACYPIQVPEAVHLAIDKWLSPAALAALAGKTVIWNAIGVWSGSPRHEANEALLRAVLAASRIVAVRDLVSQTVLSSFAPDVTAQLVPDTAFSLSRLWPLTRESEGFAKWRAALGVGLRYAVVQADSGLLEQHDVIKGLLSRRGIADVVFLPVCKCHGDESDTLPDMTGFRTIRSEWPMPLLLTEVIARADFLCASSLHACIAALNYGVPTLRLPSFSSADRKFEMLDGFEGVADVRDAAAVERIESRARGVEARMLEHASRLDAYWDAAVGAAASPDPELGRSATATMLAWTAAMLRQRQES